MSAQCLIELTHEKHTLSSSTGRATSSSPDVEADPSDDEEEDGTGDGVVVLELGPDTLCKYELDSAAKSIS